jgi:hypothetical protein
MQIRRVASSLVGAVVVYVFVACSATTAEQVAKQLDGGGDVSIGEVLDALVSPVPDAMAAPEGTSGSRIKLRYQTTTTPDGMTVKTFAGYFDSKLGVSCSPSTAGDDTLRCLPPYTGASGIAYFTDPSCTNRIFISPVTTGCTPVGAGVGYFQELGSTCGVYRTRVFTLTETAVVDYYSVNTATGMCTKGTGTFPFSTGYTTFLGVERPATDFSPMTQTYSNQ